MTSISSNASAKLALRVMHDALSKQSDIQSRIASGLSVTGAKDNGAAFAISQTLKADLASEQGLTHNLARAASTLDVALAGTEGIQDLLIRLRELSVAYSDPSLSDGSRNALRSELSEGFQQLDKAARGSTFDGVNLLTGKLTPSNTTRVRYALPAGATTPAGLQTVMASLPEGTSLTRSAYTQNQSTVTGTLTPPTYGQALAQVSGFDSQTVSFDAGTAAGRLNLFVNAYSAPDAVEIWQNGQRLAATGQPYVAGGGGGAGGRAIGPVLRLRPGGGSDGRIALQRKLSDPGDDMGRVGSDPSGYERTRAHRAGDGRAKGRGGSVVGNDDD
ncbi:MAG: flagellin [Asticcacaulis sp.]